MLRDQQFSDSALEILTVKPLTLEKFGRDGGVLSLHARRQLCLLNPEPSHSSGLLVGGIDEETERS